MKCAWQELLGILPLWLRRQTEKLDYSSLHEIRLRLGQPPEAVTAKGSIRLQQSVYPEDLQFCINIASEYSPWNASTAALGYITAPGGHRIGICGDIVMQNGQIKGTRTATSLCIRVAKDIMHCAAGADTGGSILIIGRPGSGKTTLLRDLIRRRSEGGNHVVVVDEREEIFPKACGEFIFPTGISTDVMSGCPKTVGIDMALRCMGPDTIAIDEITAQKDCDAILMAGWCGVDLLATAHAGSVEELYTRPVYAPIVETGLFSAVLMLKQDKSWTLERMKI